MGECGYIIENVFVQDVDPPKIIKDALDAVYTAKRKKEADKHKTDAENYRKIEVAQNDAKCDVLKAQGFSDARKILYEGMLTPFAAGEDNKPDLTSQQIMSYIIQLQSLDTLKDISSSKANTIFVPYNSSALTDPIISSTLITQAIENKQH